MSYAEGTRVPVSRSIDEVRSILLKAGASHYAYGEAPESAFVQFALNGLHYRFEVKRPTDDEVSARYVQRGDTLSRVDAEWRRRWRARVLWLKAQIEFAEAEPTAFAQAMLASLVLPDGRTFGGWAIPQIEGMYRDGKLPPLLGPGGDK